MADHEPLSPRKHAPATYLLSPRNKTDEPTKTARVGEAYSEVTYAGKDEQEKVSV